MVPRPPRSTRTDTRFPYTTLFRSLPLDAGSTSCRVITDGPNEDFEELSFVMMAAIAAARREVLIMTPYFLPPAELIAALQGAALRGVRTVVLLPKRNNLPYVGWAAEHQDRKSTRLNSSH